MEEVVANAAIVAIFGALIGKLVYKDDTAVLYPYAITLIIVPIASLYRLPYTHMD